VPERKVLKPDELTPDLEPFIRAGPHREREPPKPLAPFLDAVFSSYATSLYIIDKDLVACTGHYSTASNFGPRPNSLPSRIHRDLDANLI
jgi:hypothetical protein